MIRTQKTNLPTLLLLVLTVVLTSCSSTKLSGSWNKEGYVYNKEADLLVYARSKNKDIRKQYENYLVSSLGKGKVSSKAANVVFKDLKENENMTEEEGKALVNELMAKGFDRAFVMFLKDTRVNYIRDKRKEGSSNYQISPNRKGISFTDSYSVNSIEYISQGPSKRGPDDEVEIPNIEKYNTYIIEGLLYDLKENYQDQLVAVYEIEVQEPATPSEILESVIGIFSKELKKLDK